MGALFGRLFRFVLALLLAPLVLAFAVAAYTFLEENAQAWLQSWFTIGFLASFPLWLILMASGNSLVQYLEHELNHAFLAKLFGRQVIRLEVTPYENGQKGMVGFASGSGCLTGLILLAPYYVPLFTVPFLFIQPFASQPTIQNGLNFIIGSTYAFHVAGLLREFRGYQTDITRSGCLFSIAIVALFNTVILVIIIGVVMDDLRALGDYFSQAIQLAQEYYSAAIAWLQELVDRLM
jgi:hypothetical protein